MKKINLLNKRFGSLTVIDNLPSRTHKYRVSTAWLCKCDCGNKISRLSHCLTTGGATSCGCLKIKRMKESHSEKSSQWKKEKPSLRSLHRWVRGRLGVPKKCSSCNKVGPVDLANISQQYQRNLIDWEYLCRSCHMKKDGRLEALIIANKNSAKNRKE